MPTRLPLAPGRTNYTLVVPLGDAVYKLFVHWNSRDGERGAWYLDFYEEDGTPIYGGAKIVLGTDLAIASTHALFKRFRFRATDTSNTGVDAGFDDVGESSTVQGRIRVLITDVNEVAQ